MLTKEEITNISKQLSYVLRHNPSSIGITLDEHGWTAVDQLIFAMSKDIPHFDADTLKHVVETNSKKRFAFDEDGTRIRASQGHSVEVDLQYTASIPPEYLFHGTIMKHLSAIEKEGLQKMNRHHVHLSADVETARIVGARHGKPVILKIKAGDMHNSGHQFYVSANNVWLTQSVPSAFIEVLSK